MDTKVVSNPPSALHKSLKIFAKWGLAVVLLGALIKSGKLSLEHVAVFFRSPVFAFLCLALMITTTCLTFLRWKILLSSLGFRITYFEALRLGMMGLFFSTVIPGTVGGDLVKAVYVAKKFPSAKSRAVSTIIIDRVSGLIAVLLLGGIAFTLGHSRVTSIGTVAAYRVAALGTTVAVGAAILVLGLIAYPWVVAKLPPELPAFATRLPGHRIFAELYRVALDFKDNPYVLWKVVLLSLFVQAINFSVMGVIAYTIYGPPPWGQLEATSFVLSVVLGLCAMSFPLTPMGLGVGQMAFSAVFLAVGATDAEFGSGIITNFHVIQLILGLTGMMFFLSYRQRVVTDETVLAQV